MQYYNIHHIDFKTTLEIYFPRPSGKTKISDCKFVTNHGRGSLEGTFTTDVSLILFTKIHPH